MAVALLNEVFALKDERLHGVSQGQDRELCSMNVHTNGGPFVFVATGELHGLEVSYTVRLSIFRFGGPLLASDTFDMWRGSSAGDIQSTSLALMVAAEFPGEGGGGSGEPPPQPRAALSVETISGQGYGTVGKIVIAAILVDELHLTTIPPDPVIPFSAAEVFSRMRGPGTSTT